MSRVKVIWALALSTVSAACAVEKSQNPLSPTLAGPIPGIEISAPTPLEPAAGALIPGDKQPVTLLLENAWSNGPRPLTYVFEVATDAGFTNRVFSRDGIQPGDNGRTSLRLPDPLGTGRQYYWRGRAQDGANTGPYSAGVNFDVFTPVAFEKPRLLAPVNNDRALSARPEFRFANAPRVGQPGAVVYTVDLGTSDSFSTKIATWQFTEQANETRFPAPVDLPMNTQIFWRVRASEATALGPWSDTAVFRTPVPVVVAAPSPGTSPTSGGSCASAPTHLAVLECRRNQYGYMNPAQLNQFLRAVARDLNAGNHPGGPYGIYPKPNGNQCLGYSCDIICSQSGGIYDVLIDSEGSQGVVWGYKGQSSTSSCEIQR